MTWMNMQRKTPKKSPRKISKEKDKRQKRSEVAIKIFLRKKNKSYVSMWKNIIEHSKSNYLVFAKGPRAIRAIRLVSTINPWSVEEIMKFFFDWFKYFFDLMNLLNFTLDLSQVNSISHYSYFQMDWRKVGVFRVKTLPWGLDGLHWRKLGTKMF